MDEIRTLIIDEDENVTDTLDRILRQFKNVSCRSINDPGKARTIAKEFNPDLILIDIDLGGKGLGVPFITDLSLPSNPEKVFLISDTSDEVIRNSMGTRPVNILLKPINLIQVSVTLEVILLKIKATLSRS